MNIFQRIYSNTYYRLLLALWGKYGQSKYWSDILYIFNVIFRKEKWYDKLHPRESYTTTMNEIYKPYVIELAKIRSTLRDLEKFGLYVKGVRRVVRYRVSFIIQKKNVEIDGLIKREYELEKKLLFVKVGMSDFINDAKYNILKIKEGLLYSACKYLNHRTKFVKYSENGSEKMFLEINNDQVNRLEKFFSRHCPTRSFKKVKYSKRKFGHEESILNSQEIWAHDFTFQQLLFLFEKLNKIKKDASKMPVTLEDFIS